MIRGEVVANKYSLPFPCAVSNHRSFIAINIALVAWGWLHQTAYNSGKR